MGILGKREKNPRKKKVNFFGNKELSWEISRSKSKEKSRKKMGILGGNIRILGDLRSKSEEKMGILGILTPKFWDTTGGTRTQKSQGKEKQKPPTKTWEFWE